MQDSAKSKNYDFENIISDWGGYVSSVDRTKIAPNLMVRGSQNIYKKLSGNLAVRPGQKRVGAANSTASACSSEFVWETSRGDTYTMVVSDSKLWAVIGEVWYELLASLTRTRYVFDQWWSATLAQDILIFVNGSDDMFSWNGGFALIASTTATTIVLDRTVVASGLPSSGSVVVNGTTYTYSGSSASTLTGVSGNPTGEANGSGVLEAVVTSSNKPASGFAADYLKVINNQVYVGSYTSRRTYISANDDFTDYTVPTPRVAGSPELVTLDGNGKGIGIRQGNAHLGYGTNGWAVVSFRDITVGTDLVNVTTVTPKPVAVLQAPYAHEFIDSVGDNLVYLSQDQQVRIFGDFNNLFVAGFPSISQEIASELSQESFIGGGLRCIGEFVYLTAPVSGKTYLRQERTMVDTNGNVVAERLWHAPFTWNATFIDQIDGVVVAFSNANPQIYEVWDTGQWHDDSPADEPLPYSCVLALGYRGGSRRQGLWSFDKAFTEGYITEGTPLSLLINYNYQGATAAINVIVNSEAQPGHIFQPTLASIGDSSLGDESLGDQITESINPDTLPKFKVINSLSILNCFEWQPVYSSDQADAQWELLACGVNAQVETKQDASFIINKIRSS